MQKRLKALGARIWQKDDASALDVLEPLVQAHPELVGGHRLLVNGSLKFGDPARAARALERFAAHHPDHPDLARLQGHVTRATDQTEQAEQIPAQAPPVPSPAPDPLPPTALFDHAIAALNRGHPHDALNFFACAGTPDSADPAQLTPYALALKSIGDTEGLTRLLAHLERLPARAAVSMAAGTVASHLGDTAQAEAWFRRASAQSPDQPAGNPPEQP